MENTGENTMYREHPRANPLGMLSQGSPGVLCSSCWDMQQAGDLESFFFSFFFF